MLSETKARLAVLVSGRGSNCEAIAQAISDGRLHACEIAVVISNKPDAPAVDRARQLGLNAVVLDSRGRDKAEHEAAVNSLLHKFRIDLVCLAGYMRLLSPAFVEEWQGRILNIHPSLLPAFPGLHSQQQALDYGVKLAGCTVHFVDASVDGGVVIVQHGLEVLDNDTEEMLSARILAAEHLAYPEAITRVLSGKYEVRGRCYVERQTDGSE